MALIDQYRAATECPLLGAERTLHDRIPQPQVDFGQSTRMISQHLNRHVLLTKLDSGISTVCLFG
jgi:hypothetical protein